MTPLAFEEAKQRVGTLGIGALLAAAGGFLDGFTYVGHGHVFANAMTGNVVLLGINCFSGSWRSGLNHLPAILCFLAGIWVAQAIQLYSRRRGIGSPYPAVLGLEICVLLILSLLPGTTADFLFTTSIAFAASVQVQTFREVNGRAFSSTFTTGNLRTLAEAAFTWTFEGRSETAARVVGDFSVICAAFLAGATAGGYSTQAFGNRALWCDIILLVVITIQVRSRLGSNWNPKEKNIHGEKSGGRDVGDAGEGRGQALLRYCRRRVESGDRRAAAEREYRIYPRPS
jgi:uncharacterized membrane protein YoaK (UPF0700 family)